MKVQTTRFGSVEVDDSRILEFSNGLLGFSSYTQSMHYLTIPDGILGNS